LRLAVLTAPLAAALAIGFVVPAMAAQRVSPALTAPAIQLQAGGSGEFDVVPVVLWTIVAVLVLCVLGGTFYLLKRRIGAFPRNPTWVAPISIMESKTFPDEGDFGDVPPAGAHH